VIFAGAAYAEFAGQTLGKYLDADIRYIGTRNEPGASQYRTRYVAGLGEARTLLETYEPDLVIGSSFEQSVLKNRAFTGITPPLRGNVRLAPVPLAGINGTLSFIEHALNACMDNNQLAVR
jgi:hypothetical protein